MNSKSFISIDGLILQSSFLILNYDCSKTVGKVLLGRYTVTLAKQWDRISLNCGSYLLVLVAISRCPQCN